ANGAPESPVAPPPPADRTPPATTYATAHAGLFDLVGLLARLGVGRMTTDFDAQAVGCRWAHAAMAGENASELRIGVAGMSVDLVGSRARSDVILAAPPDDEGYAAGKLKTAGMSFLAPLALTIANGDRWRRLRALNEQILCTGGTHAYAQAFLERVREAFDRPVTGRNDIRDAMARAMTGIVLGTVRAEDDHAAEDVIALFDAVQSPLRRKLFGFRYRGRRERLYALIGRRFDNTRETDLTLLALAHRAEPGIARDELLQQVPHWMFTFTGSGTDLLGRTLALITARPDTRRRVLAELDTAGSPELATTIARLDFLNACCLETGRLFPPVTRTFHRAPDGEGDVIQYFPLLQRDDALGPTVHHFVPDRWLGSEHDDVAAASNLFLRGPRACPGADLILFVCRAALVRLLRDFRVSGGGRRLARDPLPLSFPEREARFTIAEATP
ncbi:MAG: cytochrome P450, partial [Longimicrobiales bacterium]